MSNGIKKLVDWLAFYYDRIITVGVLVCLLGSLLGLELRVRDKRLEQTTFKQELDALKPTHKTAAPVDKTLFEEGTLRLFDPLQITPWSTRLMVPELRVTCNECGRPIPIKATECPFCGGKQPVVTPTDQLDTDKDGMPDVWEVKNGLNPRDASDASQDNDHDGFTNLEEYRWGTDPNDPNGFPPPYIKLRVESIQPLPFVLVFMGVNKNVEGQRVFQINMGRGKKTYWAKLGDVVEGFKLVNFEEKERAETKGVKRTVDESVLTLQSGEKTVRLVKGQSVPHEEYAVKLMFSIGNVEYDTRIGGQFEAKGAKYRVKDIDSKEKRVLLEDVLAGKDVWIGQKQLADMWPVKSSAP